MFGIKRPRPEVIPFQTSRCPETLIYRNMAFFKTMLRSSGRNVRLRHSAGSDHAQLDHIAWRFTRSSELWRCQKTRSAAWQNDVFLDAFVHKLVELSCAFGAWKQKRLISRTWCSDFAGQIPILATLVNSIEQIQRTWELYVDVEYARAGCMSFVSQYEAQYACKSM